MDAKTFEWQTYMGQYPERLLLTSAGRRGLTELSPTLFALVYFPETLRGPTTGNQISFNQFHLDLISSAMRWTRKDIGPREIREAWIAPRGSGKTSWIFGPGILPTWALAHGHRTFVAAFAGRAAPAAEHLRSFKSTLRTNALLRRDFPDLCSPVVSRDDQYVAKSGAVFHAYGIDNFTLGAKVGNSRPDLILLDDIEKGEGTYSAYQKDKRLKTVIQDVFPMEINAPVIITGTTTMYGSIMHDLVNSVTTTEPAEWVVEQGFKARYYPAITTNADGSEGSLWPQRWSLESMQAIRHTRDFAMNYMNQPASLDGDFWEPRDFEHRAPQNVTTRVLAVDPAVSDRKHSDYHGIAVVGFDHVENRVSVDHVEQMKVSSAKLKERIWQLLQMNPSIRTLLVEVNQGVDLWKDILLPLPLGVEMITVHQHQQKTVRAAQVHNWYQMGLVGHTKKLPQFEGQAMSFPQGINDDMVDAVVMGVSYFLSQRTNAQLSVSSGSYL